MEATPDASDGLCRALYWPALQGLDFGAGGVEQQLYLLADAGGLEFLERDDLVPAIDCVG